MSTIATFPRQPQNCRTRGGCTPDVRCDEHRNAEPERLGDLAAELFTTFRPNRPRLYLIRGGKQ